MNNHNKLSDMDGNLLMLIDFVDPTNIPVDDTIKIDKPICNLCSINDNQELINSPCCNGLVHEQCLKSHVGVHIDEPICNLCLIDNNLKLINSPCSHECDVKVHEQCLISLIKSNTSNDRVECDKCNYYYSYQINNEKIYCNNLVIIAVTLVLEILIICIYPPYNYSAFQSIYFFS